MRSVPRPVRPLALAVVALLLALPAVASAAITNGSFESGLSGWGSLGDVSVQDLTFGTPPPDGSNQILITTIDDGQSGSPFEPNTFSGTSAVRDRDIADALGLPRNTFDQLSPSGNNATQGSGAGQVFSAQAGSILQLEWNFLTDETSINPSFDDFAAIYVEETNTGTQVSLSSLVNVAAATFQPSATPFDAETGYQTTQIQLPSSGVPVTGSYILAVAVFDVRDRVGASGLVVDHVQLLPPVPGPGAALLVAAGLAALGRRRPEPRRVPGAVLVALALALALGPSAAARAAITNGSFESGLSDWTALGDVSIQDLTFGTAPDDGDSQALLSTLGGFFLEPDPYSGTSAISDADLETGLGLDPGTLDALSPSGQNAVHGSAIQQGFTAQAGSVLRLRWNFLTDEVVGNFLWGDDFGAVVVQETGGGFESMSSLVNVAAATFQSSGTDFDRETGYQTTDIPLPVTGTYVLSVAALDARTWFGSSALLMDNVQLVPPVDEPSTLPLLAVGLLGLVRLSRPRRAPRSGPPGGPPSSR